MRRVHVVALLVMLSASAASAQTPAAKPPARRPSKPAPPPMSVMVLGHYGVFLPSDSAFKGIYGNGGVFGVELRVGSSPAKGGPLVGWLEASFRQRNGSLSFTHEATKVSVNAIEGGVLVRLGRGTAVPYVGAGGGYYAFAETNDPFGQAKQSKPGYCGVFGVMITPGKTLVVDVRVKYSAVSMKPADLTIKVGGLTGGIGVGFRF